VRLRATVRVEQLLAARAELHGVSLIDLVVKAVAVAMRRLPELPGAASISDIAVQTWNGTQTVAPVVRVAALMTVSTLASALRDLSARARTDGIDSIELDGAAITVVDLGSYGVEEAVVDVTPARSLVLTVGAVREEPVVDAGAVVAGRVMTLTLSVDEELADAVLAARWLALLTDLIEHPIRFLA
jgi:pyruvate dehydrogenase E2 component (dihydrolipoamide acetyltransferase)